MAKQLKLKIVTPERLVLEEMVDQVTIPTTEGEITVLPDHIPVVIGLKSGDVVALTGGEHVPMAVSGGFVEVKSRPAAEDPRSGGSGQNSGWITEVAVLADFAEHVTEM